MENDAILLIFGAPLKSHVVRSHLALILAMTIWGSSFVALKFAVTELSPMWVVFIRMAIGSLSILLIWPFLSLKVTYRKGDWKYLVGLAFFEPCLYFLFEAQALVYTSAGQAGMMLATLPVMVAIGAYVFLGEKSTRIQWAGFLLAIVGVLVMTLSSEQNEQAPNAPLGNFLEFLAICCAVGYVLLVKHLINRYSAFFLTAMQSFVGAAFFLPFSQFEPRPDSISAELWLVLVYLGVIVTLGAYGLYNYSMSHLSASMAASYTNLLPVFSLLFSMMLLNEVIQPLQWLSISLVFAGVTLSQRTGITEKQASGTQLEKAELYTSRV